MDLVSRYIELFFSESPDLDEIRRLLADDFWFRGPLMSSDSADDYIQQLQSMGIGGLRAENILRATGETNQIVILYDLVTPRVTIPTTEWFWLGQDNISGIRLLNDPRALLASFQTTPNE